MTCLTYIQTKEKNEGQTEVGAKTVKLTGRERLWYQKREQKKAGIAWRGHFLVVVALIGFKLAAIAGSGGVEMVTSWLNDSRGLLGWP